MSYIASSTNHPRINKSYRVSPKKSLAKSIPLLKRSRPTQSFLILGDLLDFPCAVIM